MSAEVLEFRAPRAKAAPPKSQSFPYRYFCATCKGERFYVSSEGELACAACGCHIVNLRVTRIGP